MAKIESVIREAIVRGARREVRRASAPLRREVRRLRRAVRELKQDATKARDAFARLARLEADRPWRPSVPEGELRKSRLSPGLIRKLRTRLSVSQAAVGRLVGVSAAAVVSWEQGRSTPTDQNRAALVGLRRLGRREVRRLLAAAASGPPPSRPGSTKSRTRVARSGRASGSVASRKARTKGRPARRSS